MNLFQIVCLIAFIFEFVIHWRCYLISKGGLKTHVNRATMNSCDLVVIAEREAN